MRVGHSRKQELLGAFPYVLNSGTGLTVAIFHHAAPLYERFYDTGIVGYASQKCCSGLDRILFDLFRDLPVEIAFVNHDRCRNVEAGYQLECTVRIVQTGKTWFGYDGHVIRARY